MVYLSVFLGVWIGFSIFGFHKKLSGTKSIGGGFIVACIALIIVGFITQKNEPKESSKTSSIEQTVTVKQTEPKVKSKQELLVGEWFCRNSKNYIHKVVYKSDGTYDSYESGYVPGVVSDTGLNSVGTYSIDGDILRRKYKSVSFKGEYDSTVIIKTLTTDELVLYYQDLNSREPCYKSVK